jgi:pentatricopeptide repeat protein
MVMESVPPTVATYVALITAASFQKDKDSTFQLFMKAKEQLEDRSGLLYDAAIQGLVRIGDYAEAHKFWVEMIKEGVRLHFLLGRANVSLVSEISVSASCCRLTVGHFVLSLLGRREEGGGGCGFE